MVVLPQHGFECFSIVRLLNTNSVTDFGVLVQLKDRNFGRHRQYSEPESGNQAEDIMQWIKVNQSLFPALFGHILKLLIHRKWRAKLESMHSGPFRNNIYVFTSVNIT